MARTPSISGGAQEAIREAVRRGGPLPFVPGDVPVGPAQRQGVNPMHENKGLIKVLDPLVVAKIVTRVGRRRGF